ncbi:MAG TPA: glycosyltransferase family 4 protein [Candidatus Udaeobacter sp.]|jgi:glycosyltransferase involved in cell wall biosynthesis|nr:glycosyltransferase family 4 protein [Candidatus Udaeobacter sp.]
MARFAYLFERFPSFGQTFCYREVAELDRQDIAPPIFSIRNPKDEPLQDWDTRIVERVHYLPDEKELLEEVRSVAKKRKIGPDIVAALDEWGRRKDFLRLYQAVYVGLLLRKMGIDHVHAHFGGMAARTAFWINKFFSITFSFTAHANDIFSPREFEIGLDKLVDAARVIITETDYAARFLRERFSDRADRVHRIYNGLDLADFGRADFSSTPPLIVAVGRLIPKKGFGDLIRACAMLVERGKSFRCEIFGEGPLKNELQTQIDELRLQNNVALTGAKPQTELRRRLAAANVFVLPSVVDPDGGMDNLPTVIMEAMATGLPVVSTNIGGIPEMVIENQTGFLVQSGDTSAMANAIETLIGDLPMATKFGLSGHEHARVLFSIEKNVRELCALIESGRGD